MCMQCLYMPEEGIITPGMDGWELPCRYWELNQGPLGKQPMFLNTEPSLLPWGVPVLIHNLIQFGAIYLYSVEGLPSALLVDPR